MLLATTIPVHTLSYNTTPQDFTVAQQTLRHLATLWTKYKRPRSMQIGYTILRETRLAIRQLVPRIAVQENKGSTHKQAATNSWLASRHSMFFHDSWSGEQICLARPPTITPTMGISSCINLGFRRIAVTVGVRLAPLTKKCWIRSCSLDQQRRRYSIFVLELRQMIV